MTPVRTCASCATPLPPGTSYCHQCGAPSPTEISGGTGEFREPAPSDFGEAEYRARLQHALGDDYRLGELIGRGGFGAVYRADDLKLDRTIAVKALRHDLFPTPDLIERFRREAQAIAKLRHPNVIPIYNVGEGDGLVFMMMPFIEGESLRDLLKRGGALSIEEATRIVADAARALTAAHDAGIVHRDVKPDNVLLEGRERRVLLVDFGIAKALVGDGTTITGSGTVLGTPAYLSPEQASGERDIGAASDVYSLGVVAYEMLAGRLPFDGETAQAVIVQHITAKPKPIRKFRSDLPDELAVAVMRCLAKRPRDRPTAATLAGTVGRIAVITASQEIVPAPRRRWRTVAIAAGSAVAAVAAVALYNLFSPGGVAPRAEVQERQLTFSGAAHSPAISPNGEWVAYVSAGAIRVREVAGGGATPVFTFDPSTEPVGDLGWSPDGMTILFDYSPWQDDERGGLMSVSRFGGPAVRLGPTSLARSPDGAQMVNLFFSPEPQTVLLVGPIDQSTPPDTVRLRLEVGTDFVLDASWSPDGRWLAMPMRAQGDDDSTTLALVSPDGGRQELLMRSEPWIRSLGWGPNSDVVYYTTAEAVQLSKIEIDPRTGRPRSSPQFLLDGVERFAISQDGRRVAFDRSTAVNHVWLIEAGDVVTRRSLTPGTASYEEPVISPDGQTVAALRDGEVFVIPVEGGAARPITALATEIHTLMWSPDGTHVSFKASTADGWRPMVVTATGGTPRVVGDHETSANRWIPADMGWSVDGRQVFYTSIDSVDGAWRAVDIATGEETAFLTGITDGPAGIVASPGGDELAFVRPETGLAVISIEDGRVRLVTDRLSDSGGSGDLPLQWSEDEIIYVATTTSGFVVREIWAVPAVGGSPSLYLEIPSVLLPNGAESECGNMSMAKDARRIVCSAPATSSVDVWIADDFDPARR